MQKDDILKDAIAQAKTVREVALANAKKALEEAFVPKLQSMISSRIQQEVEGDANDESVEEIDLSEVISELENDATETEVENDLSEETSCDVEEEINLDELYQSLQESDDENEETVITPEEETDVTVDTEEVPTNDDEEIDIDIEEEPEVVAPEEDEEGNETTEDWRTGYVSGYIAAVDALENENETEEESTTDDEDVDIDIEDDTIETPEAEVDTTEVDELKETLTEMKNKLNEMNLLNAKLLYTNKLLNGFSLTESQKSKVIDTVDSAKTITEVKTAFKTLNDSLTTTKPIKRPLSEGLASKTIASTKPVLTEATNPMVERFKKLANIK